MVIFVSRIVPHSFRTKNKLKSDEKVCKNKDSSGIVMPSENNKILKFNQCRKSKKCHISLTQTLSI